MRALSVLILFVAPAAWLAWQWRSMPQLGLYHDDSLYWVGAKSLAQGSGYRILSLPEQPLQTKYPPLFSMLLTLPWRFGPEFPANLPFAVLAVWWIFPVYVGLAFVFFARSGLSRAAQYALTGATALNPMAALLSFSLMPEMLFTTLLLAALLVENAWLAGVLAGLSYLTKSAGLPLLLAIPLCHLLKKQYRRALVFAGAMLPFVAGWQIWVWRNVVPSGDLVKMYYTDYFGFRSYNLPVQDLPLFVWHNLDSLLMGIGKLLTFDVSLFESKHLERVVAVAAIAGVIRLARTTGRLGYPLTGLLFTVMLLIWHYQPDQRFVFPLYPLLAAGLWLELRNVWRSVLVSWRKPAWADRGAAASVGAVLAAFVLFVVAANAAGLTVFLPRLLGVYARDFAAQKPAYEWIAQHTTAQDAIFAYDDPLVYLHTSRRSCGIPIPPRYLYHQDFDGLDRLIDHVPDFAREHRLDYLLLTPGDFYRDLHERGAQRLLSRAASDTSCRKLFDVKPVTIYAVH